jgi:hypothetical protein
MVEPSDCKPLKRAVKRLEQLKLYSYSSSAFGCEEHLEEIARFMPANLQAAQDQGCTQDDLLNWLLKLAADDLVLPVAAKRTYVAKLLDEGCSEDDGTSTDSESPAAPQVRERNTECARQRRSRKLAG